MYKTLSSYSSVTVVSVVFGVAIAADVAPNIIIADEEENKQQQQITKTNNIIVNFI